MNASIAAMAGHTHGPTLVDTQVQFRLWAPGASRVELLLDDAEPISLSPVAGGFWSAICDAAAGAHYYFEVDGVRVPDPASRFQPRDTGGPSTVLDDDHAWRHPEWRGLPWEEAIFYELHVGILGGFAGVRARLPALAELGVTALELMPIADFAGGRNWGYDGVLPFAPDSAYGHPNELRSLIDEAHGLGMMVFLDVVYNHFGPEGNWLPAYAPQFFDEATPTPWGAAIDFRKAPVRRLFIENALYWLQSFRFDGLRLDAVHAIMDRSWLVELASEVRAKLGQRHVHLVVENENNDAGLLEQAFTAQWNDDFHNVLHVLLTGETHAYYKDFAERPAERLARCLAEGFIYQGEPSPNHAGRSRGQKSAHLSPTSFVSFLQNHDQVGNRAFGERLTRLARPSALKAAMALLLLCPQIPLLFMGEEYGAREPFLFFTDFHGELAAAVREGRRREFTHMPGFDDPDARAAIPDPNSESSFAASIWTTNAEDAADWQSWVRALLTCRKTRLIPHLRDARAIGAHAIGEQAVMASWRLGNGAVLTMVVNLGTTPVACKLPSDEPIFGACPTAQEIPPDTTLAWITP